MRVKSLRSFGDIPKVIQSESNFETHIEAKTGCDVRVSVNESPKLRKEVTDGNNKQIKHLRMTN